MKLRDFGKLALAGTMAFSLAACSSDGGSSDGGSGSGSADGEVSVFYYTYGDTYISSVRSNLDSDLKEAGINFVDYDANNSQTTQTEQVQTAISKGSKCLVVNLVDTASQDAAKNIIDQAEAADIPVIFFNRSVDEEVISAYDKAAFVGTDYEQAGIMQGDMIGDYLVENFDKVDLNGDGEISYVMFKGQEGNAEADARTKYGVENADAKLDEAGKKPLKFYDSNNSNKFLLDKDGAWSAAQGTDLMQTVLSQYNPANKNMVELVIANNDDMALGAISALENEGYNKSDSEITIPVFGVDATDAAVAKINEGAMTGTIKQDAEGMAGALCTMVQNMMEGKDKFDGLDSENVIGTWRINIPYSTYTGE
ncbi:galactose ABC transporter substrate-binding protein [uncultured Faecalibaculum sp.]|uniref:galactose ABC transporter substrate-binding protein n=1 Tax=uncultured Faecalibaculum sp. TaxID=1729681 RepID=UPI0025DDFD6A|nr:galactose ABC transporter substrate-binding protein [uncultured Faecalibaculum sp.]